MSVKTRIERLEKKETGKGEVHTVLAEQGDNGYIRVKREGEIKEIKAVDLENDKSIIIVYLPKGGLSWCK